MNVEKRLSMFFRELVNKIRDGQRAVASDDCESKSIYVDVVIGYGTSEVSRVEHKIELWMEKEESDDHADALDRILRSISEGVKGK